MSGWARAFGCEMFKLRRSLAFRLALVAPLVVVFLQFVLLLDHGGASHGGQSEAWLKFGGQTLVFWCLLMLPLFITLETALEAGLEHAGSNWTFLFALPVSRGAVYAAKLTAGLVLIGLSMLVLLGGIGAAGLLVRAFRPELGLGFDVPWRELLRLAWAAYLSCWLLIALHAWVGMRWKNFVVAMGFGIAMTIAGILVINSRWAAFYPWTIPTLVLNGAREGNLPASSLWLGCAGGVIAGFLGGWEFTRRDVL